MFFSLSFLFSPAIATTNNHQSHPERCWSDDVKHEFREQISLELSALIEKLDKKYTISEYANLYRSGKIHILSAINAKSTGHYLSSYDADADIYVCGASVSASTSWHGKNLFLGPYDMELTLSPAEYNQIEIRIKTSIAAKLVNDFYAQANLK